MKTCYFDLRTRVIADLIHGDLLGFPPDTMVISRINVPQSHRGKGLGTKILKEILKDADSERVKLVLEPLASGGLNRDQLISWYRRNGFIDSRKGFLSRDPK